MLFPSGWPRSFSAFPASYGHDEIVSCIPRHPGIFPFPTTLLASKRAVQLWAATDNPFKIGHLFLQPSELLRVGPQVAAEWNPELSSIISLTSKGYMILYTVSDSNQKLISGAGATGPLRDASVAKIKIHATIQLYGNSVINHFVLRKSSCEQIGNCLVAVKHMVWVGTGDGVLHRYDWAKMLKQMVSNESYAFRYEGEKIIMMMNNKI